jgi:carboxyl-terminal processing protease
VKYLAAILLVCPALAQEPVTPMPGTAGVFRQFAAILDVLQNNYIDPREIQPGDRATIAFREFVRTLDVEADLLTPSEYAATTNATFPLPVRLAIRDGRVVIVSPHDGTAAQRAGILADDELLCNERRLVPVQEWLRQCPTFVVRDPTSHVGLTISNDVPTSADVRLVPLAAGIAYCRLPEIQLPLASQLRGQLLKQKPRALVLDLRNNPGGTLDGALQCASLFLPENERVVAIDYAQPEQRVGFVSDASSKYAGKLAVLVNGGTAAEAEILAAALRDNGRATLIGSRTFGSGWLYGLFALPDGSALRIPTARYLPPSKRNFQGTGLTPDVLVTVSRDTERELARAGFGAPALKSDHTLARARELLR